MLGQISIHSPLRGETRSAQNSMPTLAISIHSPLRGETYDEFKGQVTAKISIHSPLRGETLLFPRNREAIRFQSTRL